MRVWIWVLLVAVGGRIYAATGSSSQDAYPDSVVYHSGILGKEIVIEAGEFSEPAAPGSASKEMVKIVEMISAGSNDGLDTRILVLISATGGSGSYTEIALVAHLEEGWKITDSLLLGDRVRVEGVTVEDREVVVNVLAHGRHDPLCCPSEKSTRKFTISSLRLVANNDP